MTTPPPAATPSITEPPARPRVVIVGAGFGGLEAARKLADVPVDVLLLDRTNYHLFTPLLYQVATAGLSAEQIAHPVRPILHEARNVAFRVATVSGVDLDGRTVTTDAGPVPYDYLVLAAGSTTNFFSLHAPEVLAMKDLPEALRLRNHTLSRFEQAAWEPDPERRRALLTFVVVGGGPTGVEMAGALAELLAQAVPHDFPKLTRSEARVILIEADGDLLGPFRPRLRASALRALEAKGVQVRLNTKVKGVEGDRVQLADGDEIRAHTLIWAAGVRAADLAGTLPVEKARQGRLPVDRFLRLRDHEDVFVIGDMAALDQDGATLPMLAPVAMQEGAHVARTIGALMEGGRPRPFHYRDRGTMATIGRNQAVAQIGPVPLTGFIAWLAWLTLHLVWLVGFRNRLTVLINWAWDYFRYERAVRIITVTSPDLASLSAPALPSPGTPGESAARPSALMDALG